MKKTLPALICAAFLGTAAQAAQVDIFGAVDMYVGVIMPAANGEPVCSPAV